MAKTKYDFIKELLENNKINQIQRERILDLVSNEISIDGTLEKRIQKIEDVIFNEETIKGSNFNISPYQLQSLPEYIDPINLYNALLAYNQNPILKTTCHPISTTNIEFIAAQSESDGYDYFKHIELIKKNFNELAKDKKFTTKMYVLIKNYITGEGAWSSQHIKESWSDKLLEDWAKSNPNMVPNPEDSLIEATENEGYKLQKELVSKLTNKTIRNFSELVLYFKSLWHIKDDNPLQRILEKRNIDYKYKEWSNIKFLNFSQTLNLFTDIDKLVQAYSIIINLIKEKSNENHQEILISFFEEGSQKTLSIHQLSTFWKKSIIDTIERPFGNSMVPLIENQINGLCDLHIRAKFEGDQFYEVNLWDGKERKAKPIPFFDGVEYLLILKK